MLDKGDTDQAMSALSKALAIGDSSVVRNLLSLAYENEGMVDIDNERLEFLGDAVLDLAISHMLYRRYPEMREGEMTRLRALLVKESHLAEIAVNLDLGKYLFLTNKLLKI